MPGPVRNRSPSGDAGASFVLRHRLPSLGDLRDHDTSETTTEHDETNLVMCPFGASERGLSGLPAGLAALGAAHSRASPGAARREALGAGGLPDRDGPAPGLHKLAGSTRRDARRSRPPPRGSPARVAHARSALAAQQECGERKRRDHDDADDKRAAHRQDDHRRERYRLRTGLAPLRLGLRSGVPGVRCSRGPVFSGSGVLSARGDCVPALAVGPIAPDHPIRRAMPG